MFSAVMGHRFFSMLSIASLKCFGGRLITTYLLTFGHKLGKSWMISSIFQISVILLLDSSSKYDPQTNASFWMYCLDACLMAHTNRYPYVLSQINCLTQIKASLRGGSQPDRITGHKAFQTLLVKWLSSTTASISHNI